MQVSLTSLVANIFLSWAQNESRMKSRWVLCLPLVMLDCQNVARHWERSWWLWESDYRAVNRKCWRWHSQRWNPDQTIILILKRGIKNSVMIYSTSCFFIHFVEPKKKIFWRMSPLFWSMKKSGWNILRNVFFCVPQIKRKSHTYGKISRTEFLPFFGDAHFFLKGAYCNSTLYLIFYQEVFLWSQNCICCKNRP